MYGALMYLDRKMKEAAYMHGQLAYIAAPIFNDDQRAVVEQLKEALESTGFEIFSPYHASQKIFNGRKPADCTPEERAMVLRGNVSHLHCHLLLAWVGGNEGGFTDPGVVWEMGYAGALAGAPAAFGRGPGYPFTLAYIHDTDERQAMNLMLAGTVDGVVKGGQELAVALAMGARRNWATLSSTFTPDRLLAQDKEPVV